MADKETTYTKIFADQKFQPQESWIVNNLVLESIMGSHAYGCQTAESDYDIVGVVMDKHECLFPQMYNHILGFDQIPSFENKECKDTSKIIITQNKKDSEYEGAWHSLTNFFNLVANGSPNLTEVLFVNRALVTYAHDIGWMLRDHRRDFLSTKMYFSFKGYAFSQFARIRKEALRWKVEHKCDNTNRIPLYEKNGYDVKMSYHTLRLLDLIHQLLTDGDLNLMRNKEECKVMRAGEWGDFKSFEEHVEKRLAELDSLVITCKAVPNKPQRQLLHDLLANCIEQWYGSESKMQKQTVEYVSVKMLWDRLDGIEKKIDNCATKPYHDPHGVYP
jgi:predicted nucleotidyltransferase